MREAVEYVGVVDMDSAKFEPDSPGAFRFAFAPFKGKKVRLRIEEWKATRSNQQNRAFYALVVRSFCEYMGYRFGNEREKEYVKAQVLEAVGHYTIERGLDGKEKKLIKSTSRLDKREFSELFEACQQLGAENGIVIDDPDSARGLGA